MTGKDDVKNGLRLLVLEAGDTLALSQLDLIEELLHRVYWERKLGTAPLKPCEYFHLIAGVGTGGIIAILLVVFRLTVQEARDEFLAIAKRASLAPEDTDDSSPSFGLLLVILDLFERHKLAIETKLCTSKDQSGCLTFVCSVPEVNVLDCRLLRNYPSRETTLDVTISEAIQATISIPPLFSSISLGPAGRLEKLLGGEISYGNPTREAIAEAYRHFGPQQKVASIVSIGSGSWEYARFGENVPRIRTSEQMQKLERECERTALNLDKELGQSKVYYRFSVNQRAQERSIEVGGLEPHKMQLGVITSLTRSYISSPKITQELDACIRALEEPHEVTIADIHRSQIGPFIPTQGLPVLSPFFVTRQQPILDLLQALLNDSGHSKRIIVTVSGMSGTGKTQLVAKFAREYVDWFPHVLFIDGSSTRTLNRTIVSRVRSLKPDSRPTTYKEALSVLSRWNEAFDGRWLMIVDNFNDANITLMDYIPECDHGSIIVTTRNEALGHVSPTTHIKLGSMSTPEAVDVLLLAALPPNTTPSPVEWAEAKEIVEKLGNLPVALVQAGCYIRQTRRFKDYLPRFETSRRKLLEHQVAQQPNAYAAFSMTAQRLSTRAQQFLRLFSFAHHSNFPRSLVSLAATYGFQLQPCNLLEREMESEESIRLLLNIFCPEQKWDEYEWDMLLIELQTVSLVSLEGTDDIITLHFHPLLQSWSQDQLTGPEKVLYRAAFGRLLSCGAGKEDVSLHAYLISHIETLYMHRSDFHVNDLASFADLLAFPNIADKSVEIWESVYSKVISTRGIDSPQATTVALRLAHAYALQGDDKRSERVQLQLIEKRHEKSHRELLDGLTAGPEQFQEGMFDLSTSIIKAEDDGMEGIETITIDFSTLSPVAHLQLSPNGQKLAVWRQDATIQIFEVGETMFRLDEELRKGTQGTVKWVKDVKKLEWSPDGTLILTSWSTGMQMWSETGTLLHRFHRQPMRVKAVVWLPSSSSFLSIEGWRALELQSNGKMAAKYELDGLELDDAAISPDLGHLYAVGSLRDSDATLEKRLIVYNLKQAKIEGLIPAPSSSEGVKLSKCGEFLLLLQRDSDSIYTYSTRASATGAPLSPLRILRAYYEEEPVKFPGFASFIGDNDLLVCALTNSGDLIFWDRNSGTMIHRLRFGDSELSDSFSVSCQMRDSGFIVATAFKNGRIGVFYGSALPLVGVNPTKIASGHNRPEQPQPTTKDFTQNEESYSVEERRRLLHRFASRPEIGTAGPWADGPPMVSDNTLMAGRRLNPTPSLNSLGHRPVILQPVVGDSGAQASGASYYPPQTSVAPETAERTRKDSQKSKRLGKFSQFIKRLAS